MIKLPVFKKNVENGGNNYFLLILRAGNTVSKYKSGYKLQNFSVAVLPGPQNHYLFTA